MQSRVISAAIARINYYVGVRRIHVSLSVTDAASGIRHSCLTSIGRPMRHQLRRQRHQRLHLLGSREGGVTLLRHSRSQHVAAGETDGGPDTLAPADSFMTWTRGGAVKIRLTDSGPAAEKPQSIMTFFRRTVERLPNYDALVSKVDGNWKSITYGQYYDNVRQVARGFIELGLEPQSAVGILGFNSPEWNISCIAAIFAGAYATGIYLTNSPDACHHVAHHARCNIIVVDDDKQLQKILSTRSRLPHLKAIIQYRGQPDKELDGVYSWSQLMEIGSQSLERELEARIRMQAPNKGCMLVYTSGTTGDPKGAMLSHDNLVWTSYQCRTRLGVEFGQPWKIVSYLPLSHVAAEVSDIFSPIVVAATVYFAEPDALKGSLGQTLKDVRPNHFFAVPRVWEKMQEAIMAAGKGSGPMKRKIIGLAKDASLNGTRALMEGRKIPLTSRVANALIMRKVDEALGIDRCQVCVSAAAPISRSTIDFFQSLGIPLVEVYGMTEATGPHTIGIRYDNAVGSVGREISGSHTEIDQPDENGVGELLLHGRNVFMGYLDMKELTIKSFSGPLGNYYHTGDLGKRDEKGFLYVNGRIKEILITSGGENIPSAKIELTVLERLSVISNCMLLGDGRKYLTMLLTIKTDINMDTMTPLDTLTSDVINWCRALGSSAKTVSDVINDVTLRNEIQKGIDDVNRSAASNAQKIQKWTILPTDFSIAGGELGPTLKLRRHIVLTKYDKVIESMYTS